MENKLIKNWSSLKSKSSPYILKGDEGIKANDKVKTFKRYGAFIDSDYTNDKHIIHLGLLPVPYAGNIRKAKIFILLLNPGFEPIDYYAEYNDKNYRRALLNNLKQKNLNAKYPFKSLCPSFLWTGGGRYWSRKFSKIIEEIIKIKGWSYQKALSLVSRKVAIIEYFPYHSKQFALNKKELEKLESPKLAVAYVRDVLKPKADKGDILILVTRLANVWGLKQSKNIKIFNGSESRAAHLGKYKKEILKHLGIIVNNC